MKLKYERFEGMGCLYVRGDIDASQVSLLTVGLETFAKDLEESLLVNFSGATLTADVLTALVPIKKKLATATTQKIYWIAKDKPLGDFVTVDLFISRLTGFKFRQIGDRIKLEDEVYALAESFKKAESREAELSGTAAQARAIVLENKILKEQKRILEESVQWQHSRIDLQKPVEPTPKVTLGTETAPEETLSEKIIQLKAELKKALGHEVDL